MIGILVCIFGGVVFVACGIPLIIIIVSIADQTGRYDAFIRIT